MQKTNIYKQLYDGQRYLHKTQERIAYFQKLLKQKKYTDQTDIKEFINGSISLLRKDYDKAIVYYNKAIEIDDKYPIPYNGLGNVYYNLKDYDKAIEHYNKAIEIDDKYPTPYNGLGNICRIQKKYDKAIKYYDRALAIDDKFCHPYNNIGVIYSDQKDYDKAIEFYNKALAIDDKFCHPYNNIGVIYSDQKDYDKAIEFYNRALAIDDKYSNSYNNIGTIYSEQKDYDKSIEYYNKAIEFDNTKGLYYRNLALDYKEIQDLEKAKINFLKAIKLYKKYNDIYQISLTEKYLTEVNNKIESQKILENKEEVPDEDKILKLILKEIQDSEIDIQVKANKEKSLEFLKEKVKQEILEEETYFEVLRRWNSYTPIVADNYYTSKGGGYFIKVGKEGIVIDPGFNFIDNFRGMGHKFYQITIVLISHAHNDHTSDLESILTLLHKYNENIKKKLIIEIAEKKGMNINDVKETEINAEFLLSNERKIISFYITKSIFIKYSGLFELYSRNDYNIHIIEKNNKFKITKSISCYTIEAKHNDIISDRDSVGFLLSFDDTSLIYTGDTGWSDNIEKQYKKIKRKCKNKYLLLIAHLGGFKEYEMNYLNQKRKEREKYLYKNHLGRIGLTRLNEILKPDVCLISEFGEEFKGHRRKLADIFQKAFNNKTIFLPADIGLKFCLKKKQFQAITKIDSEKNSLKMSYIDAKDVNSCLLRKDYSLHYFTDKSNFTETDLIQIIIEKFEESAK